VVKRLRSGRNRTEHASVGPSQSHQGWRNSDAPSVGRRSFSQTVANHSPLCPQVRSESASLGRRSYPPQASTRMSLRREARGGYISAWSPMSSTASSIPQAPTRLPTQPPVPRYTTGGYTAVRGYVGASAPIEGAYSAVEVVVPPRSAVRGRSAEAGYDKISSPLDVRKRYEVTTSSMNSQQLLR
jgi:hypothetical protein